MNLISKSSLTPLRNTDELEVDKVTPSERIFYIDAPILNPVSIALPIRPPAMSQSPTS